MGEIIHPHGSGRGCHGVRMDPLDMLFRERGSKHAALVLRRAQHAHGRGTRERRGGGADGGSETREREGNGTDESRGMMTKVTTSFIRIRSSPENNGRRESKPKQISTCQASGQECV